MTSRTKRLAATKRQDSAGDMDDRHGGDIDQPPSDFEAFVLDQFQKILEGQSALHAETTLRQLIFRRNAIGERNVNRLMKEDWNTGSTMDIGEMGKENQYPSKKVTKLVLYATTVPDPPEEEGTR
ncbi:hypothetical protein Bbelb_018770 [Branchiostoma belcheri]|nr:hypothetical protein Bbelb_018770 [Branchiostoma belcheri]